MEASCAMVPLVLPGLVGWLFGFLWTLPHFVLFNRLASQQLGPLETDVCLSHEHNQISAHIEYK